MERAAATLRPIAEPAISASRVTFLTGSKFWYQTAFCAVSLVKACGQSPRFEIVDDGTLASFQIEVLRHVLTGCQIVAGRDVDDRLDEALPLHRFPWLRKHRLVYPHLRKLVDVHAGRSGARLVLDSDMLFFGRPDLILDWLVKPHGLIHMVDIGYFYGYPEEVLKDLVGSTLPHRVNVGVCGLLSESVDWERLEYWVGSILNQHGQHYLLEQALVAMMAANWERTACPEAEYIVGPGRNEAQHPDATLHHYVGPAKAWYFRFGWREALRRIQA